MGRNAQKIIINEEEISPPYKRERIVKETGKKFEKGSPVPIASLACKAPPKSGAETGDSGRNKKRDDKKIIIKKGKKERKKQRNKRRLDRKEEGRRCV